MLRPQAYCREYVTFRPLPYVSADVSSTGGVLSKGQVVWVDTTKFPGSSAIRAFVDEVGLVMVDPRSLLAGEVFRERAISEQV